MNSVGHYDLGEKDAVLHLNSNSSKAEERRPCTIGLIILCNHITAFLKFRLSEKHTKFEKNLPHGVDKLAALLSKRQDQEEDVFKLCVLLKKSELYSLVYVWIMSFSHVVK